MDETRRYEHLNNKDEVKFSIPDTAKVVMDLNYGQQRLLAEILKLREKSQNMRLANFARNTQKLRDLLEGEWF